MESPVDEEKETSRVVTAGVKVETEGNRRGFNLPRVGQERKDQEERRGEVVRERDG